MEKFVVSARKYRPSTFNDVVGQSVITNILKSAIKSDHLAHAFIFCGPRGVGKTTCARILAKTINCQNRTENIEPCNECDSCKSFNDTASFNVHELDAASNNSVEDIRTLIDQVRIPPQVGEFSTYIIDEVHMLSQAAFNAFLKTLEEPPKHAIFILATTEKHKIIPTILSRCQIFNFKRIQNKDIVEHLKYVAKSENITAEEEALHVIAQKSDGAMRDSLSIFDQVVSSSDNEITYKNVIENLNILDADYYFKAVDYISQGDMSNILLLLNSVLDNGFEGQTFSTGLNQHIRDLLVCKDQQTIQLLEVGENQKKRYSDQSQKCPDKFLLNALEILNQCDINYKMSQNQRLLVELSLLKLCALASKIMGEKKSPANNSVASQIVEEKGIENEPSVETIPAKPNPEKDIEKVVQTRTIKRGYTGQQTISISQQDSSSKEVKENVTSEGSEENVPTQADSFTQEEMEKVWNEYALICKNKGKHSLYSSFSNGKPKLEENFIIKYHILNSTEELEYKEEKVDLLGYLRKQLGNYSIDIELDVREASTESKLINPKDKFLKMAEKNPALKDFQKKFGLNFDSNF